MPFLLISQQMLLEHEILARLSDALRTVLGLGQHGDMAHKCSSTQFLLESFERHLERMLEQEEQDGYMEAVEARWPQFQPQIAVLRQEHREFRETCTRLLHAISSTAPMNEPEIAAIFTELLTLLQQIESHNKRETDLLQEVILQPPVE